MLTNNCTVGSYISDCIKFSGFPKKRHFPFSAVHVLKCVDSSMYTWMPLHVKSQAGVLCPQLLQIPIHRLHVHIALSCSGGIGILIYVWELNTFHI